MNREEDRLIGLPPVMNASCRTIVLGSMPGALSLTKQQYYGHPRNHFWRLLYTLFGSQTTAHQGQQISPSESYEERLAFALSHGIGLWDVLASCEREGSLDTNIRHPEPNDFGWLFREYPQVSRVFFNGQAAGELYRKRVLPKLKELGIGEHLSYRVLPSTSPARTLSFEAKLESWAILREEATAADK
ncbi:DNA-deoxyinosine glycosylase [Paenibacillus sp. OAS669]|uniref:DNA-deoxyinosine glycosylase n=1 Tax=Paenibacillus sp. OAS669 TaxID=2663821 RepID=UPI0019F2A650|nr:DNA-deoxyinosine glycosylase [Paenibacillus sp. OAS669]MBE1443595.1 hypoxanthine-DNA glycosylase [Paenibacillus sp. OAS669]